MKAILGAVLAGVLVFVWGAVFWTSGFADGQFKESANDASLGATMQALMAEPGTYYVPGGDMDSEEFTTLHRNGPVALIHIQAGSEPMQGSTFALGFAHNLLVAFLAMLLLRMAAPALPSYGARLGFVVLIGITLTVSTHLGETIWWPVSGGYALVQSIYALGGWLIAGLVLAWAVTGKSGGTDLHD